jgi:hypothetical protein
MSLRGQGEEDEEEEEEEEEENPSCLARHMLRFNLLIPKIILIFTYFRGSK